MNDFPAVCSGTRLEVLGQLLASATHDASAAMCRWTDGLITLALDEVRELDVLSACVELELGEEPRTMVALRLEGALSGEMLLIFDDVQGRRLADAMLAREPSPPGPWSELERSVLMETGNILGCTYLNALARLIGAELVPSPPHFTQDYGASVLEQVLLPLAMTCEQVLVCRTNFHSAGQELDWQVLFIPGQSMRQRLDAACGKE